MRYNVPHGGLLQGRLSAEKTPAVSDATTTYGTAALLFSLAIDAGWIVALGRNAVHSI